MKFFAPVILCAALAACASNQPTPVAAPLGKTAVASSPAPMVGGKVTPEKIAELQRAGYKIVDRDGRQLFCRIEKKTGSQITRDTVCMTAEEVESLRELTQRRMVDFQLNVPPPQGK